MSLFPRVRRLSSTAPWFLALALTLGAVGCHDEDDKCKPEVCDPPINPDAGIIVDPNVSMLLTKNDAFYARNGLEFQPRDFSAAPAELLPDDGGTPVPGVVMAPGVVRFDVPPGTYMVKSSSTQYFVVSWRSVDLSTRLYGRPGRGSVFFPNPVNASLNLLGLAPDPDPNWNNYSDLSFHSLDIEDSGSFSLPQELAEGQTSLVTMEARYSSDYGNVPRFDPAQGDSAWVVQTQQLDAGPEPEGGAPRAYTSLVRAAHLNPFAFNGGVFSVEATLQPAPEQTVRFDWRRDEFNALRIASTTGAPSVTGFVDVYPALKTPQEGWFDYTVNPMLDYAPLRNSPQVPVVKELSFGNPYPMGWEPMAHFSSTYSFNVTKHDGSRTVRANESFLSTEAASELGSTPVRPRVSLPRSFQVEGVSAATSRILGTATPLVSWDAPALGTATGYVLQITRYNADISLLTNVARIYMGPDERSVRLPPGLLTSGNDYVLRLTAHHMPGVSTERGWLTLVVPSATATTSSAMLTLP